MSESNSNISYWEKFWNEKCDPLHPANSDEYFDNIANELKLLIPNDKPRDVLELGCGNGVFYERLGFSGINYLGVDLSDAMIRKFSSDFPSAKLCVGSATDFTSDKTFDLIFTNQVIQYLNKKDFSNHLELAVKMLKPKGQIIHASIPWKALRWSYLSGELRPISNIQKLKNKIAAAMYSVGIKKDSMGTWYKMNDIRSIALDYNLKVEFFGSFYSSYRFHTRLSLK